MTRRSPRRIGRGRGFTLIEIVIVLGILAVLAALLVPAAFQSIQSSKETATRTQVERVFKAIVGDPSKGNFGYLGDMGRLPATLDELVTQGSQIAFHTSHTAHGGSGNHVGGVGAGWRGPYLTGTDSTADLFKDAWGLALSYTNTGNNAGQVVSGGADGQISTASDNITYPVQVPIQTTGTIIVTVIVNEVPQPINVTVKVYSISGGNQGAAVVQTTPNPSLDGKPFRFDVPHGTSAIESIHTSGSTTVTRITTIDVAAGTQVTRTILMKTSASVPM